MYPEYLRSFDQVALPKPLRIGTEPIEPFKRHLLDNQGGAALFAGQEIKAGADAEANPAGAARLGDAACDDLLIGRTDRQEAVARLGVDQEPYRPRQLARVANEAH